MPGGNMASRPSAHAAATPPQKADYDRPRDMTAVEHGISAIGRVVVAAALIMGTVFAAFILGADRIPRSLASCSRSRSTDALIVRMTLVPAFLTLLREKSWYIPQADRVLPNFTIEPPHGWPSSARDPRRGVSRSNREGDPCGSRGSSAAEPSWDSAARHVRSARRARCTAARHSDITPARPSSLIAYAGRSMRRASSRWLLPLGLGDLSEELEGVFVDGLLGPGMRYPSGRRGSGSRTRAGRRGFARASRSRPARDRRSGPPSSCGRCAAALRSPAGR